MNQTDNKKILIIHGPNLNLLGIKTKHTNQHLTLEKLNRHFRKSAQSLNIKVKIIQTNDEAKAIKIIQSSRRKINGIILLPGPWQKSGHCLSDTLMILAIPFVTISSGEKVNILLGIKNFHNSSMYTSAKEALIYFDRCVTKPSHQIAT